MVRYWNSDIHKSSRSFVSHILYPPVTFIQNTALAFSNINLFQYAEHDENLSTIVRRCKIPPSKYFARNKQISIPRFPISRAKDIFLNSLPTLVSSQNNLSTLQRALQQQQQQQLTTLKRSSLRVNRSRPSILLNPRKYPFLPFVSIRSYHPPHLIAAHII